MCKVIDWRVLATCGAVLTVACSRPAPVAPSDGNITFQQAQYSCGRVSGTRQETSVETRGQRRVAAVALFTSSAGVGGTLATSLVGIKDDSEKKTPTLITGAISVAVTAATAAIATYLTGSDDTKVQGAAVAKTKEQADAALADLDRACTADPNSVMCSYAAARAKGRCDALAKSLPFEP